MKKCATGWKAGSAGNGVRVDWSLSAVADLKAIAEWIEQDRNLATANRITRAIPDIYTLFLSPLCTTQADRGKAVR
jgi:hypothetical protein